MEFEPYEVEQYPDGIYMTRRKGQLYKIKRSVAIHECVTLDFDESNNLVGVEVSAIPKPRRPRPVDQGSTEA